MVKKNVINIFCLVLVLSSCSPVDKHNPDQPSTEERIDDLFTRYTNAGEFSGSILVAKGDQVLFRNGYGFTDREEQIPNTPDTQFSIQSITKLFTYASVMMEVKADHISLNDPVEQYFPGFPNGDKITIDHLLHHRSGLFHYPHEVPDHEYGSLSTPITINALIKEFEGYPLKFEPGEQYGYSNAGYSILARVVENLNDTPFDEYLEAKLFAPTGMHQTTADWETASQDIAIGYEKVDGEFIRSSADHPSHFIGSGTTYTTIDDMYSWYKAVYINGSMSEFSSGGGDGGGMGYRAIFWPIPSFDLVIIILSNYRDAPVYELVTEVVDILLEETTFIDHDPKTLEALIGHYMADSGYGVFNYRIYGSNEKLFVSVTDFLGVSRVYELRPISPNQLAFLTDGRLTGQTLTFKWGEDANSHEFLFDMNLLQLKAIRDD
ncbi:MAG: serine hydrolase domain-containing protein [Anaerolineales bacterium]